MAPKKGLCAVNFYDESVKFGKQTRILFTRLLLICFINSAKRTLFIHCLSLLPNNTRKCDVYLYLDIDKVNFYSCMLWKSPKACPWSIWNHVDNLIVYQAYSTKLQRNWEFLFGWLVQGVKLKVADNKCIHLLSGMERKKQTIFWKKKESREFVYLFILLFLFKNW